jgi:hypothetical protein
MKKLIFVDQTGRSFKKLSVERYEEIESGYEIGEILIERAENLKILMLMNLRSLLLL